MVNYCRRREAALMVITTHSSTSCTICSRTERIINWGVTDRLHHRFLLYKNWNLHISKSSLSKWLKPHSHSKSNPSRKRLNSLRILLRIRQNKESILRCKLSSISNSRRMESLVVHHLPNRLLKRDSTGELSHLSSRHQRQPLQWNTSKPHHRQILKRWALRVQYYRNNKAAKARKVAL